MGSSWQGVRGHPLPALLLLVWSLAGVSCFPVWLGGGMHQLVYAFLQLGAPFVAAILIAWWRVTEAGAIPGLARSLVRGLIAATVLLVAVVVLSLGLVALIDPDRFAALQRDGLVALYTIMAIGLGPLLGLLGGYVGGFAARARGRARGGGGARRPA